MNPSGKRQKCPATLGALCRQMLMTILDFACWPAILPMSSVCKMWGATVQRIRQAKTKTRVPRPRGWYDQEDGFAEPRKKLSDAARGVRQKRRQTKARLAVVERRELMDFAEAQRRRDEGLEPKPAEGEMPTAPKRPRLDVRRGRGEREAKRAVSEALQAGKPRTGDQLRYECEHLDDKAADMVKRALLMEKYRVAFAAGRTVVQREQRVPPCPNSYNAIFGNHCEAPDCEQKSVIWPLPLRGAVLARRPRRRRPRPCGCKKAKKATPKTIVHVHQVRGTVVEYPGYTMKKPAQPAFNMDQTLHRFLVEVYGRAPTYRELSG